MTDNHPTSDPPTDGTPSGDVLTLTGLSELLYQLVDDLARAEQLDCDFTVTDTWAVQAVRYIPLLDALTQRHTVTSFDPKHPGNAELLDAARVPLAAHYRTSPRALSRTDVLAAVAGPMGHLSPATVNPVVDAVLELVSRAEPAAATPDTDTTWESR